MPWYACLRECSVRVLGPFCTVEVHGVLCYEPLEIATPRQVHATAGESLFLQNK